MEKFSHFYYQILPRARGRGWYYEIYSDDFTTKITEADESFDSAGTARYAAIGHIHLLESGKTLNNSESEHS